MNIPENLKYTVDHEWVMIEERAKVGILIMKMHSEMLFSLISLSLESELPSAKP